MSNEDFKCKEAFFHRCGECGTRMVIGQAKDFSDNTFLFSKDLLLKIPDEFELLMCPNCKETCYCPGDCERLEHVLTAALKDGTAVVVKSRGKW